MSSAASPTDSELASVINDLSLSFQSSSASGSDSVLSAPTSNQELFTGFSGPPAQLFRVCHQPANGSTPAEFKWLVVNSSAPGADEFRVTKYVLTHLQELLPASVGGMLQETMAQMGGADINDLCTDEWLEFRSELIVQGQTIFDVQRHKEFTLHDATGLTVAASSSSSSSKAIAPKIFCITADTCIVHSEDGSISPWHFRFIRARNQAQAMRFIYAHRENVFKDYSPAVFEVDVLSMSDEDVAARMEELADEPALTIAEWTSPALRNINL